MLSLRGPIISNARGDGFLQRVADVGIVSNGKDYCRFTRFSNGNTSRHKAPRMYEHTSGRTFIETVSPQVARASADLDENPRIAEADLGLVRDDLRLDPGRWVMEVDASEALLG